MSRTIYAVHNVGWNAAHMVITLKSVTHYRNLKLRNSPHPPVSLAPILDSASISLTEPIGSASVTTVAITRAGYPVVSLGNGDAYTYSRDMFTWMRLSESWWAVTSQYWDASGLKPPAGSNVQGNIGLIERRTDDAVLKMGRGRYLQRILKTTMLKEGFKGLETAVSIGHLEVFKMFILITNFRHV